MSRISVITPAKATDEQDVQWLREAINSVRAQSFDDWEMVIVNDHSEQSWSSLKGLFSDERIRGASAKSIGVAQARNQAAEMATSPLLLPLDADDWLDKDALAVMNGAWKEGTIVYGDTVLVTQDAQRHFSAPAYSFDTLLSALIMPIGSLHSKADWERVGGWKPEMEYGLEDWEYWIALGELGVCGHRVPQPLYYYRRHPKGRLSYLRENKEAYDTAYQMLRSLHNDTYNGRRPVGCCNQQAVGSSMASGNTPAPRPPLAAQLANLQTGNLSPVMYIGAMQGFFVRGRVSGINYAVDTKGQLIKMPDGRLGADPKDVPHLLAQDRGRSFVVRS